MKNQMLLCEFMNEVLHIADMAEFEKLCSECESRIAVEEDDDLNVLWEGIRRLGAELVGIKTDSGDVSRNRRIAALTKEETAELAEAERIITENCFGYHFQPIVSASDGSVYSYEALMRPQSSMGLTPLHMIKYAELTDRLVDIERATFLNVLGLLENENDMFFGKKVFINSIPKTRLKGDDFRNVNELLMKYSNSVVVEMTEQTEADDGELNALKERYSIMGIDIAIDDYGTGYSSIKNLLRYMPNYVKIDRSLIGEIQSNPKKRHFVREIIEFCHDNGILALAEGVETTEELRTVILLGADLIQGYYTARPSGEVIEHISYEIKDEIRRYQQERQDGRDQQVYAAENTERVLLDRLVKEDYRCILIGKDGVENGDVTIIGSPSLDTEIHIEIAKDFKGRVTLENVNLSNVKNRPCIDLSENSDVLLVLGGENKLKKSGIRVPENSRLTIDGKGTLDVTLDAVEYYGIGNDIDSSHGEIVFILEGTITINAYGKKGVCIGSGRGGTTVVEQGKIVLNMNSEIGVGIGTFYEDCKLDLSNCDINTDISLLKGVAIGTLGSNADIHIWSSAAKIYMGCNEAVALGTVSGDNTDILINDANVIANIRADRCTGFGSLEQNTSFVVRNAAVRVIASGDKALPFGGFGGETKVSLTNVDTSVKLETAADFRDHIPSENVSISSGRTIVNLNGYEVELKTEEL